MTWYYTLAGQEYGPVSEEDLAALAQSGKIGLQTYVWREGLAEWIPYSQLTAVSPPPVPPVLPPETASPGGLCIAKQEANAPPVHTPVDLRQNKFTRPENAQAVALIEANRPIHALRPLFRDSKAALTFYGEYMNAKYSEDAPPTECVSCGKNPGEVVVLHYYEGLAGMNYGLSGWNVLSLLLGYLIVKREKEFICFSTAHCYCQRCAQTWKQKRFLARWLYLSALFGLGVFLVFLLFGVICYATDIPHANGGVPTNYAAWWVKGMIGISASVGGLFLARMLRLPKQLWSIERRPFRLKDAGPIRIIA